MQIIVNYDLEDDLDIIGLSKTAVEIICPLALRLGKVDPSLAVPVLVDLAKFHTLVTQCIKVSDIQKNFSPLVWNASISKECSCWLFILFTFYPGEFQVDPAIQSRWHCLSPVFYSSSLSPIFSDLPGIWASSDFCSFFGYKAFFFGYQQTTVLLYI